MNQETAKQYLHEFLSKPGIINLEEEDVHFFLGKEGSMECAYGFGTSTKERGLMPAVNAAIKDLRRSLSEKPEGIIFTVYGDACLVDVNEAANCVADCLCNPTTNMILSYVAAGPEEPLEVMIAVATKKK